jgi:hypothetical protein
MRVLRANTIHPGQDMGSPYGTRMGIKPKIYPKRESCVAAPMNESEWRWMNTLDQRNEDGDQHLFVADVITGISRNRNSQVGHMLHDQTITRDNFGTNDSWHQRMPWHLNRPGQTNMTDRLQQDDYNRNMDTNIVSKQKRLATHMTNPALLNGDACESIHPRSQWVEMLTRPTLAPTNGRCFPMNRPCATPRPSPATRPLPPLVRHQSIQTAISRTIRPPNQTGLVHTPQRPASFCSQLDRVANTTSVSVLDGPDVHESHPSNLCNHSLPDKEQFCMGRSASMAGRPHSDRCGGGGGAGTSFRAVPGHATIHNAEESIRTEACILCGCGGVHSGGMAALKRSHDGLVATKRALDGCTRRCHNPSWGWIPGIATSSTRPMGQTHHTFTASFTSTESTRCSTPTHFLGTTDNSDIDTVEC